jgi:c-di-GMP-binding flagellar brake protein YcgR
MHTSEDQRQNARKVLRTRALLIMDGIPQFLVRTIDISTSGVGVACPQQLHAGQEGKIAFEMFFNGKNYQVASRVKVMYCIYSSSDGFKVGLQFLNLDMGSASAITKFMI